METKLKQPSAPRVSGREYSRMDLKAIEAMSRRIRRLEAIPYWSSAAAGAVMEGPGIDLVDIQVGLGGDTILLYNQDQMPVEEWAPTSAGLDAALASAVANDIIFLQAFEIDGNHTIPAGVILIGQAKYGSILTGQITLSEGSVIENLSIIRTFADANDIRAVLAPASGIAYMRDICVTVTQGGSGNIYAVEASSGGDIEAYNCIVRANAEGGSFSIAGQGYAGRASNGMLYIFHGSWRGTTDRFLTD